MENTNPALTPLLPLAEDRWIAVNYWTTLGTKEAEFRHLQGKPWCLQPPWAKAQTRAVIPAHTEVAASWVHGDRDALRAILLYPYTHCVEFLMHTQCITNSSFNVLFVPFFAIRNIFLFNLNYIKKLAIDCACPEVLLTSVQQTTKE